MSFFSDAEIGSLCIDHMILHIVGGDEFRPERELEIDNENFLLTIIKDIASSSMYRFDDNSRTKITLESIYRHDVNFETGAQDLASEFSRFHPGAARDGAFFIFQLGTELENKKIFALMKYDYAQALELVEREGSAGLRRIVEAFVGDKSAIQKSALVRIVDGIAEIDISTRDRMGRPSPEITEYFARYLQVSRSRSNSELTEVAKKIVSSSIQQHKDILPHGEVSRAVSRGFDVLRNTQVVSEAVIKNAVLAGLNQPEDEEQRLRIERSVEKQIRRNHLSDIDFHIDRGLMGRPLSRTIKTAEGVRISYPQDIEGQAVQITTDPNGSTRILVITQRYEDEVAPEETGRRR